MEPSSGKVIKAVAAAYDLALDVTSPVALGGAMNRVLRVSTPDRDLVLRVHRRGMTPERLVAVHQVQERLRLSGLPVPDILTTREGTTWIGVDDHLIEVLAFVAGGHEVASWTDAEVVFAILGRFHGASRAIDARGFPPPVHPCYAIPDEALSLLGSTEAAFRAHASDPGYPDAAARETASALLHRVRVARRAYEDRLPQTLIHGDFVGYNVLLANGRVIAILDFDRLAVRERVYDIAYTLDVRAVAPGPRLEDIIRRGTPGRRHPRDQRAAERLRRGVWLASHAGGTARVAIRDGAGAVVPHRGGRG